MAITKRAIINLAFSELGLGAYAYDIQPEDYTTALEKLDDLMAEWSGYGIETGYPLNTVSSTQTMDEEIGLILQLKSGVAAALAVEIAPDYGKVPSPHTVKKATKGKKNGLRLSVRPPNKYINITTVPAGAGYKRRHYYRNLAQDGPLEILPGEEADNDNSN